MERKTPLYDCHKASGGKLIPFAGYLLPVQYETGIIAEHMAVRTKAGLFDVSHMGEILYTGPDALANLQHVLTNDLTTLRSGQVRYSTMCREDGGVIDDLIIYKFHDTRYMAVVNAVNRDKDVAWMRDHLFGDVTLEDISDTLAQIALQGPAAEAILRMLAEPSGVPSRYYHFVPETPVAGIPCLVSQTGYTGERGYELYIPWNQAPVLWNRLLEAGRGSGLIPCGLGARDTLRLAAGMPLYGHEMDETITPLETGLAFAVKLSKPDFIGKKAIQERQPAICRIGLKGIGRGIIRENESVYLDGNPIGHTTSGTHCPYLGFSAAMALVDMRAAEPGTKVEVDVRGRRIPAEIVPLPFYRHA